MENTKQNSLENKAISPKQSTDRGGRAPFFLSYKLQASGYRRQATSFKLSWRSVKQQALDVGPIVKRQARRFAMVVDKTEDRGTSIKFYGPRSGLLGLSNQYKIPFCMCLMPEDLMRTKHYSRTVS